MKIIQKTKIEKKYNKIYFFVLYCIASDSMFVQLFQYYTVRFFNFIISESISFAGKSSTITW